MRSYITSWKNILTKLGFTRKKRSPHGRQKPFQRRLGMESLESRQMLTIVVDTLIDERDFDITADDISLRDAILEANPGETINFAPSLNGQTINLLPSLGEIAFSRSLTIDASMLTGGLTINAATADPTPNQNNGDGIRIFDIERFDPDPFPRLSTPLISVTIDGLRLTGGDVEVFALAA